MKKTSLENIITSKVRIRLLSLLFKDPRKSYFQSELLGNDALSAVQYELKRLLGAEILICEAVGRRRAYRTNQRHDFYPELKRIFDKSK